MRIKKNSSKINNIELSGSNHLFSNFYVVDISLLVQDCQYMN